MKTPGITAQAAAQAVTLVRTAIANAVNVARLQSFSDEGVTAIEWVAVIDDVTTDECLGLDGLQWIMPEDPADYEGYIGIGHNVPFVAPPIHWNCRSTVIPVEGGVDVALPLAMENTK
jgi:SPP1 gp7 family putative phage head morphogenesis protein